MSWPTLVAAALCVSDGLPASIPRRHSVHFADCCAFFFCLRVGASMPDFFIADAYFLMIFYFADAAVMSDLLS